MDCSGGVPGFMEILMLALCTVYSTSSQAASHSQEVFMSSLWSSAQLIEQELLWTLRFVDG
jgi:hypothetical protein